MYVCVGVCVCVYPPTMYLQCGVFAVRLLCNLRRVVVPYVRVERRDLGLRNHATTDWPRQGLTTIP